MKISYLERSRPTPMGRSKFVGASRLCIILLCIMFSNALYANYAVQQANVTINVKNATVKEVLKSIAQSAKVEFFYSDSQISQITKRITINYKSAPIEQVLKDVLNGTNFTFKFEDNSIVILPIKQTPQNVQPQKQIVISGKVSDKETGLNMQAVTVIVMGTVKGTTTGKNGEYTISVPANTKTLTFTFVGYNNYDLALNGRDQVANITLTPSVSAIDNVVITGIFRKSAESYTGSQVTVNSEQLKAFGNRNVLSTLRNIDPSFNIVESNTWGSNPNRLPEVQIRGNSSLPNVNELKDDTRAQMNTPLVVIDGFESTLQKMIDMNENDIDKITLLKDASATSLYGSRGANGVIVISTKVPEVGKLKISYRGDANFEIPDITSYSLLNAKDKLDFELKAGKFVSARAESQVPLTQYYNYLLNEVNSGVNTHWLAKPLRVGIGHRHNVRLEGGDQMFRYSAAIQYNDIQGAMKGSSRKNFNGTVNLSYNYKNLRFSNNLIIGVNNSDESPYGEFQTYTQLNPYFRTHDDEGNVLKSLGLYGWGETYRPRSYNPEATANPLYDATLNTVNNTQSTSITDNFMVDWNITQDLILKGKIGITKDIGEGTEFYPADHTMFETYVTDELIMRKGQYKGNNNKYFMYDASLNLSYSKLMGDKHLLYAGVDYNVRESTGSSYDIITEGFTNADLNFISMALQYEADGKPSGTESKARAIGATGTVNYTYDNRYYVDASVRLDGSSAFGADKRFAPFWSAGIGWNLHREKFLTDNKYVTYLKLRASVGIVGSQNFNPYQALQTYQYYTKDRYYKWIGGYLMGLGNEDLQWQQKTTYNLGLDSKFFNDRLMFNFDVYTSTTSSLISSVDIPLANGFSSYTENIGELLNTGFEAKLTGVVIRQNDWFWSVTGAIMHNKNTIKSLSPAMAEAQKEFENEKSSNPNILFREGYSPASMWAVRSLGIDPSNGMEVYLDRFGDITYTWDARDKVFCGISEPKYQGNINTTLRYKKLTLNASFGFRFGGQMYNQTLINKVENIDYDYNVDSRVYLDRWQNPGDITFFKGINNTTKTYSTSRFVQPENTFNCQNVNIMYEFSSDKLTKAGINYLTVAANFADLFYISTVRRERGTSYPFARQASLTLNISF